MVEIKSNKNKGENKMLRSMYSGISGMKGFQTKLDVIGNNIANVNTTGFKKGRATFQDAMSQMSSAAQGPTPNRGGVNPKQVGTGAQLGTIDNIHTQGSKQTTDRTLDLQLEGDGMFVLDTGDGTKAYTRAGNFYLDNDGFIVNADGHKLVGTNGNVLQSIPENASNFNIQTNGDVTYVENGNQESAGQIGLAMFSNPGGLEKDGNSLYLETTNAGFGGIVAPESGNAETSIVSGALEMSNVDLSEEFTEMITAQRGFQANTRIITTSDEILQELVNLKR